MYISHLEHASFSTTETSSIATTLQLSLKNTTNDVDNSTSACDISTASVISTDTDSSFDTSSITSNKSEKIHININGVLNADDACRAVYALSNAVDHLFDAAATALPVESFRTFLDALIEASHHQLFGKNSDLVNLDALPQGKNNKLIDIFLSSK